MYTDAQWYVYYVLSEKVRPWFEIDVHILNTAFGCISLIK